ESRKLWTFGVRITDRGDVVGQRVEPYINDVVGVARDWNSPAEAGARDRQVAQARLNKADDLVAPAARRDRIRICIVIGQEPVLPRRKPKKVVFLLQPFDLGPARRLPINQFTLVVKRLVAHRIPPGKAPEINLAAAL